MQKRFGNQMFEHSRGPILSGEINWLQDDIRVLLLTEGYEPDFDNHKSLTDVPIINRLLGPEKLKGKIIDKASHTPFSTGVVLDAYNTRFDASKHKGRIVNSVVFYRHDEDESKSRLIGYYDIADPSGPLPTSPLMYDTIDVEWDDGPKKMAHVTSSPI